MDEMRELAESFMIALEAAKKSPHTVDSYRTGIAQFLAWCDDTGTDPDLTSPAAVRAWLVSLSRAGRSGGTMHTRLAAVRAFAAWLAAEGELPGEPGVLRAAWPRKDEKAPPALSPAQLAAVLEQCRGRGFPAVRDAAMFSLMFDSMVRADELLAMRTDDVNLRGRIARVRRGKGGRERFTAFSAATAQRLDRYGRLRRRQPYAHLEAYWLGQGGRPLSYDGLYAALRRRGDRAGITVHPHMLRAGGAINWRRKGGTTESLMTIAGWKRLDMAMHYTRAAETELALEEAHRLLDE